MNVFESNEIHQEDRFASLWRPSAAGINGLDIHGIDKAMIDSRAIVVILSICLSSFLHTVPLTRL